MNFYIRFLRFFTMNVQWLTSQKGQPMLVVDDYIFSKNGKGKNQDVLYWICASNGHTACSVRATTERQVLTDFRGVHNHEDSASSLRDKTMKVKNVKIVAIITLDIKPNN